jgi:outer membrane receptor protein involved in Fe transport
MLPLYRQVGWFHRLLLTLTLILFFSLSPLHLRGAELARRPFALPAADAEVTLETFSDQAGAQVVYLIEDVRGVTTNPVQGVFAIRDALERLVARTALRVEQDGKSGAFVIRRDRKSRPPAESPRPTNQITPQPMKSPRTLLAVLASWLALGSAAEAQTATTTRNDERAIVLNPFVVESDSADSYSALNTNSITRFRTDLKTMPITADIFTESFMKDIGATDVESMLTEYSPAGFGGANPTASGQGLGRPGDYNGQSSLVLRGVATGASMIRRNGFLPHWGGSDNFFIERVEVIRGPQSLLFGDGGAGGVVNNVAKQARFGASVGEVQIRTDEFGSLRSTVDYGRSFGRVAVRFAAVAENTNYARLFSEKKQLGAYAQLALRLNPQHTLRLSADRLRTQTIGSQPSLTLRTTGPRNGQFARLALAQGQSGDVANSSIDWNKVDSFAGEFSQRKGQNDHVEIVWDGNWNRWFSTQVSYGYDAATLRQVTTPSVLTAPGLSGNPTGVWAIQFTNLQDTRFLQDHQGFRAVATAEFDALRGHHQLIGGAENNRPHNVFGVWRYYELDASGQTVVNPAQVTNINLGRNQLSTLQLGNAAWAPVGSGPVFEPLSAIGMHAYQDRVTVNGRTYERQVAGGEGKVAATPQNPRGLGGTGWQGGNASRYAGFVAGTSVWLDQRLTTLYGVRRDQQSEVAWNNNDPMYRTTEASTTSYNLGANYRLRDGLHAFYGHSISSRPNGTAVGPDGVPLPPRSEGKGHEVGLKFDLFRERVSGSLAYYTVKSIGEAFLLQGDYGTAVNPNGINGRRTPSSTWIGVDRDSAGVEMLLTAQPIKGWRSRLNAGVTDGIMGESRSYAIYYNDQFHTNGRGGVTFGDGSALLVKVNPNDNSPTAPTTQLTTAMMNTSASPYFADLDPDNGRIRNAAFLGLTRSNSTGASVGTGLVGLPLAQHQLNFTDPNGLNGSIPAVQSGLPTTSYAKYSLSWTNTYTIPEGSLKGLMLGGTLRYKGNDRSYYYNDVTVDAAGRRQSQIRVFGMPDAEYVDLIASYGIRFGPKVRVTLQLNIQNAFDNSSAVILPNSASGAPQTARLAAEPRFAFMTATFNF